MLKKIVEEFEDKILALIKEEVKKDLPYEFTVENILKCWQPVPDETRRNIGKKFAKKVKSGEIDGIKVSRKDSSNKSYYKKI